MTTKNKETDKKSTAQGVDVQTQVSTQNYSFAILILDDMKLKFFKYIDEFKNAIDTLKQNDKRLVYFKKLSGYWVQPVTWE